MKAMVTGAGGFIGSFLTRALIHRGYAVRGLFLAGEDAAAAEAMGVEVVRGDLTRPETLEGIADGIDVVFHLAARVLDWGAKPTFRRIAVDGTRHLLDCCRGRVKRLIYFSSIAALGIHRDLAGLDEEAEAQKSGIPYGDTKAEAERLVTAYGRDHGLDTTIIRPANVIGPGSVWVRDVLDAMLDGPAPLIAGGSAPGAFVSVHNLVDGAILAAESPAAAGRTYHFRDDFDITWAEYIKTLGGWVDRTPVGRLPLGPARRLGALLEFFLTPLGIRPPVTRLAAEVMGRNHEVDTTRSRRELGWQSRVSLDEAMAEIRDWVLAAYRPSASGRIKHFYHRVVYITGGSSGIGLATARLLAAKGAHIVMMARDAARLEAAAAIVRSQRRSECQAVFPLAVDVTDEAAVRAAVARAVGETGAPDVLINSAGIVAADHFENISSAAFDAVLRTNVYGPRNVIAAVLPYMKSGGGHIVNVSSAAGLMGMYGYTAYGTSKFALVGFSEALRSELKPRRVRVSVVCPPEVDTPMIGIEAATIPAEAKAVKRMAGQLTAESVARSIANGIRRGRFMIIPGKIVSTLYLLHCFSLGWATRRTTDVIVALARRKNQAP